MAASNSPASLKELAFADFDREIATTRRVLERLPEEHFAWKPHEKSMNLGDLAMHVATLFQWMLDTLKKDELDLATTPRPRKTPDNRADLLRTFEQAAAAVKEALDRADDAALARPWTLRRGSQVLLTKPRTFILRTWSLNHMIHHRAQLCVYLRLLNVPVPAVYFNSVDEPEWILA